MSSKIAKLRVTVKNTPLRYGFVAMTFHWIIAILIIANVALGVFFVHVLDSDDAIRPVIVGLHESVGITILVLSLLRFGWRLVNPVPNLPADFGPRKRLLARGTHYALYALMILVPLLGWQLASIQSRPLRLFGVIPCPKLFYVVGLSAIAKKTAGGIIGPAHWILAFVLFGLALGHVCAALFYHYAMRRDRILQRMVPGTSITSGGSVEAAI